MDLWMSLFALLAAQAEPAPARPSERPAAFDFYQASINARDCKVTVFLNDRKTPELSGDGSQGLVASMPLFASDLRAKNTIRVLIEPGPGEPALSLNVEGVLLDEEPIIDTRAAGNTLALDLDAQAIAAAKRRELSASFDARLRGKHQPIRDPKAALAYALRLLRMFERRDHEGLAAEMLPELRRRLSDKESDADATAATVAGLREMLEHATLKRVDPSRVALEPRSGGFRCAPVVGGEAMIVLRQKGGASRPVPIVIGHVEGSLRIVQLR